MPALASGGAGRLLCLYEKREADGATRIAGRMLTTR